MSGSVDATKCTPQGDTYGDVLDVLGVPDVPGTGGKPMIRL